jgi:hypothetical protein
MLKITKSVQPIQVNTLVVVLYSAPGLGKTTMAFTAEKPLLLDFDKGAHRSKNRRDVVIVDKWSDVTEITAEDLANYKTLVVDTAGRALDVLTQDIIHNNPKAGRGGALTLQGYGELRSKFTAWVKMVRSFGLDVVLLAHADEQRSGDEVIERLDVQGGSKNEIYKSADVMGRIVIANKRRMLNLSPTDTAFGKNPGQLPPMDVPDYGEAPDFLAGVIAQTKAALNALTEEQTKAAAAMAEWKEKIDKLATVEEFNATIEPIKAADESVRENVRRLLHKAALAKGLVPNKATGAYYVAPAPAAAPPAAPPAREPGSDDLAEQKTAKRGKAA